jgi:hypothetical protein
MSSSNGQATDERYWELASRLASHEAMCAERSKAIDARLETIDKGVEKLNHWGVFIGFTLLCSMAGILVTLLLK